jgi:hypothetical protein
MREFPSVSNFNNLINLGILGYGVKCVFSASEDCIFAHQGDGGRVTTLLWKSDREMGYLLPHLSWDTLNPCRVLYS